MRPADAGALPVMVPAARASASGALWSARRRCRAGGSGATTGPCTTRAFYLLSPPTIACMARAPSPLTPLLLPSTGMAEPPALGTGAAGVDGHVDWSAVDQFQSANPLPVDDGQHLEQHSPQHSPQQPLQQPPQQRRQQHSMQAAAPAMLNNTVTLHKATSSFPLDHAFVGDAVRQLSRAPDYRRDLLRVRMEDFVAFRSTAAQVILFRATAFFVGEV